MAAPKNDTWLAESLDWLEAGGVAVTLFTNGMVVTGLSVSPTGFYFGVGEQLDGIAKGNEQAEESLRQYFSSLSERTETSIRESREWVEKHAAELPPWIERTPEQDQLYERFERNFIHLRDVAAIMAGGVTLNVPYWRGRLSEIAGWCIGRAAIG